ncbi:MAG: endoglucanase [Lachnospiraceae bacterium]|nr:endoglucanase [Lachnospiraceae bacterium]
MQTQQYTYRNLPIPGGGYVTGFLYHPGRKDVLYIRTDIGGVYRFDADAQRWVSLIDHVTMEDLSETFPTAVALDDNHPERLYIACGIDASPCGKVAVSDDYGETFRYYEMPLHVHGNMNGRGTGCRLIVDKRDEDRLWFASQDSGLWCSPDRGVSWENNKGILEKYMTLVGQSEDGTALFVGCAGAVTKRSERLRGHSMYVSYDNGVTFEKLWQPRDGEIEGVRLAGLVAQRYTMDEKYLYVTYAVMGKNAYVYELGYSCDGGSVIGGRVVRYPIIKKETGTRFGQGEEITPGSVCGQSEGNTAGGSKGSPASYENYGHEYGFGGISAAVTKPGLVVCSTISKENGDSVYRSYDYGQTWEEILYDLDKGKMEFRTSYMEPCYNGGHSIIHWLSDLKVNPFDEEEAWFNTGTGVFRTRNLTGKQVVFSDWCDGLEETVHLNLYSPPAGEVKVIDILGDLGGFAFRELDKPCDNSFDDADGNRYITCINADYSDENPDFVVVTPRGNWKGKTKGGLIISENQCRTFRRLPMPYGITEELDEAFRRIETPNVNSGWVAVSPDCSKIVWSVARGDYLPISMVVASTDGGEHFVQVKIFDLAGERVTTGGMKVFSDRIDSNIFYGFGEASQCYVSLDGGLTFRQHEMPKNFPKVDFALIDCASKIEVRGENGKQGVLYMALDACGLWKFRYDINAANAAGVTETDTRVKDNRYVEDRESASCITTVRLSRDGDIFYRMGLGVLRPGGDYCKEDKAIYTAAVIDGVYGFYRSEDDGKSFVRLNTDRQMYGEINSVEGDSRVYGRFYLATGSRGVLYGEPVQSKVEKSETIL